MSRVVRNEYQEPWALHDSSGAVVTEAWSARDNVVMVRELVEGSSVEAWIAQWLVSRWECLSTTVSRVAGTTTVWQGV
jgi:hypothetical protein